MGFGTQYATDDCPEAIFLMIAQCILGTAIQAALVGIVYAKLTRPARHSQVLKFSKKAVVCQRNSKLCFVFRVCDPTCSHIIDTKIEAYWFAERLYDTNFF